MPWYAPSEAMDTHYKYHKLLKRNRVPQTRFLICRLHFKSLWQQLRRQITKSPRLLLYLGSKTFRCERKFYFHRKLSLAKYLIRQRHLTMHITTLVWTYNSTTSWEIKRLVYCRKKSIPTLFQILAKFTFRTHV